jgi:hypothetical protein
MKLDELFPRNLGKHPKETLERLLKRLKIKDRDWDLVLVGDGSGSNWKIGAGWACVSIERLHEEEPRVWFGAMNRGTVNLAEMLAYVQPLTWYAAKVDHEIHVSHHRDKLTRNVHIITDSDYCRDVGTTGGELIRANGPIWQIFKIFSRYGIFLHWHWRPREDVALNVYVDALSKAARLTLDQHDPQKAVEQSSDGQQRSVTEYNPWQ